MTAQINLGNIVAHHTTVDVSVRKNIEHSTTSKTVRINQLILVSTLIVAWVIWAKQFTPFTQIAYEFGHFILLGISGAIFANSTGAGGGVIFIPVFSQLGFSDAQSISTSFAIQCFGMTAGAVSWSLHFLKRHQADPQWHHFATVCYLGALTSILGLWSRYGFELTSPASLHQSFSIFSILLGLIIIYSSVKISAVPSTASLTQVDYMMIPLLCYVGGIITSWLSVGVGELLVIYLMLRGFCAKMAIASGVVVSAITVWAASPIHLNPAESDANFYLVLFAGPGAIIGGILARKLALYLPVPKLKLFFAIWIVLTGITML